MLFCETCEAGVTTFSLLLKDLKVLHIILLSKVDFGYWVPRKVPKCPIMLLV